MCRPIVRRVEFMARTADLRHVTAITSPSARSQGFTLIEVMIAATILMFGLLGTFTMLDGAQSVTRANSTRTLTLNLAREITEHARSVEYNDLTPDALIGELRTKPNIAGTIDANGKWVITRRGIQTTVTASVCTFDDPMDGLATPPPQNACPAAAAVANAPTEVNPDDFRRVTLTMQWKLGTKTYQSTHAAQINNPNGGTGPRITSFPDPFAAQVTSGTSIAFNVSTTISATVSWSMDDGVNGGDAAPATTGSTTAWRFNWNIGTVGTAPWVVDGTYVASAQPFDQRGVPGERRAATVLLNRRAPLAPTAMRGGRSEANGGLVEVEWDPNPERDILGYRVYRTGSTNIKSRVCPPVASGTDAVVTTTYCADVDPGNQPLYTLVAVDRPTLGNPSSGTREGDTTTMVVSGAGARPGAPQGLVGQLDGGRVSLTWTAPSGNAPLFYRIYRDGVRVNRTATADTNFVDPVVHDGSAHTYQVSAVSDLYNESEPSAGVVMG
jgi:prepilin-type N-terminal cleavage/methylation domain-containing protein